MRFEHHIFICANQKEEGKTCCGTAAGMELVEAFRAELKARGLQGKVRAQRAGCLDACKHGPALVIYPEGTYYGHVGIDIIPKIIESHIMEGKVLTEYVITF